MNTMIFIDVGEVECCGSRACQKEKPLMGFVDSITITVTDGEAKCALCRLAHQQQIARVWYVPR